MAESSPDRSARSRARLALPDFDPAGDRPDAPGQAAGRESPISRRRPATRRRPIDEARRAEARDLLASLAGEVPEAELEVAMLARVDGMTHDEIGLVTERSGRTVRRLLAKFDERIVKWKVNTA